MFHTCRPGLPTGSQVEANDESSLSEKAREQLLQVISWFFVDQKNINSNLFGEALGVFKPVSSSFNPLDALRQVRSETREQSTQHTAYKYCFAAGVLSQRTQKEVHSLLKDMRPQFSIDSWEMGIIHDAMLGELKAMPSRSGVLPEADKLSIIALCCLLLRIDSMTHISETEMLRLVTANLRSGAVAPASLMTAMGRKPTALFSELDVKSKPWALINIARIACADTVLRPSETEFFVNLVQLSQVPANQYRVITRAVYLETGINLPEHEKS